MNYDEKKRQFVEPELLKCEDSLVVITMGGYHGSSYKSPYKDKYKKCFKIWGRVYCIGGS